MDGYSVSGEEMALYSGSAFPELAEKIAQAINLQASPVERTVFADGERRIQYQNVVRGKDLYLVQPTSPPSVNDHFMELLLMIDAARRAGAATTTVVMPYMGYSRQDRMDRPRVPISSKVIASALEEAGADHVVTMNLHADQIQGFYDIPVSHFYSAPVLLEYIEKTAGTDNPVLVAPDAGAANRVRALSKRLDWEFAIIDKRRPDDNESKVENIVGNVNDREVFLVDDMIDTGGTITSASRALKRAGARKIRAAATHPLLSDPAIKRILNSPLQQVLVCNTMPVQEQARESDKFTVVDVSGLIGEAIELIQNDQSVSKLYV